MPKGIPKNGINKGWFKKGNKITLGYKHTLEAKKKISDANIGDKNSAKRPEVREKIRQTLLEHVVTEKTRKKLRKSLKGKRCSPKTEFKKGHPKPTNAYTFPCSEKHPNWINGKSFEPYGLEFNRDLKEVIRNRDRRKCQICKKTELKNKEKLTIHHIDYNKRNNNPNNLISLCRKCHTKTNFNRKKWIKYFNKQ